MASEQKTKSQKLNARSLAKHKKRFLRIFPDAFLDERYIEWERTYKWEAHKLWNKLLNKEEFKRLMHERRYDEIATRAMQVESKTNFLFSFEKMALRDGIRTADGARIFADGLYQLLYEQGSLKNRFVQWIISVSQLPRKKSRVLSWPVVTFFPFIAQPSKHIIMKPSAMKFAAEELGFNLDYSSTPTFTTYQRLLDLANLTKEAIKDLKPKDYHDLQTFLWVIGSAEYDRLAEELGVE